MRVVITGGHGFLGRRICEQILETGLSDHNGRPCEPTEIVLVDVADGAVAENPRVRSVVTDLSQPGAFAEVLGDDDVSVFHLASMVSAESELDWSRAVENNVGAVVELVEAARDRSDSTRVVFASSVAVFGGTAIGRPVGPDTKQTAESTYGMTKAIGEMMVNDATRKGFLDGRSARLPTVVVRPGRPNRAASGFFSGLFREPLSGQRCVVPVADDVGVIIIGPATATASLIALHDVPTATMAELGVDRAIPLPGLVTTVGEMVAVLDTVGGGQALDLLDRDFDGDVDRMVRSWATEWDDSVGRGLGLPHDESLLDIVHEHLEATAAAGA